MRIIGLLIVLIPTFVLGQESEANKMIALINWIYKSDSSHFIFDLNQVPTSITKRILQTHDSLTNIHYKKNWKASKLNRFMANTYDDKWNPTDVMGNEHWPSRRFIYAIKLGTKWVVTYEHGGIGSHYHVVYFDTVDNKSLTTSTTLLNWEQIQELISGKKINEIKKHPFAAILDGNNFKLLRRQLVKNYDIF